MWNPVVTGRDALALERAVREIAADLDAAPASEDRPYDRALFLAYAAGALDDPEIDAAYERAVDAALSKFSASPPGWIESAWGLAGAGFVLAHISDGESEVIEVIDRVLGGALETPWEGPYDLVGGIVGLGMYQLERARTGSSRARAALAQIVRHLVAAAGPMAVGRAWLTLPHHVATFMPEAFPRGQYNLGVAHGAPGAIACLAAIAALDGIDLEIREDARALALDAAAWLETQAHGDDGAGCYGPYVIGDEIAPYLGSGWCYGDPGVSVTMWSAMTRVGAPSEGWRALARRAAVRSLEITPGPEPGLCHGAAGLAHLFGRCYNASGDELFLTAAKRWLAHALALRSPGTGVAGWSSSKQGPPGTPPIRVAARDILDGAAGIGLAFLGAMGTTEPAWDRLMCIDLDVGSGQTSRPENQRG